MHDVNCEQIQNLLGRFRDGEISPPDRAVVAIHLEACTACAAELAALNELGEMAKALSEPEPPGDLWDHLAKRLAAGKPVPTPARRRSLLWKAAVLAALVLMAVTTGWLAHSLGPTFSDSRAPEQPTIPVVNLGPYLGPQMAMAPHQGKPMKPQEAAQRVGFHVLTMAKLPEGYSLEESYLVRLEGCNVVQYKYLRGRDVALLLQYSQGQPVKYGDRPVVAVRRINGKPVEIIQGEGQLAASWKANGTAVCLVGPREVSELVRLVDYVDQQFAEDKK